MIIEFSHGNFVRFNIGFQFVALENPAGLFVIETGGRSFGGAVGPAPIGEYESFEVPVFLQEIVEEVFVLAGIVAVETIVGAHDGGDVGLLDPDLEGEKIALSGRALVDIDVDGVAATLLIVEGVMLDIAEDM